MPRGAFGVKSGGGRGSVGQGRPASGNPFARRVTDCLQSRDELHKV
jgi:hypothetical protein